MHFMVSVLTSILTLAYSPNAFHGERFDFNTDISLQS